MSTQKYCLDLSHNKRVRTAKAHTLVVSNPCLAAGIILVPQNLSYEPLPDVRIFCAQAAMPPAYRRSKTLPGCPGTHSDL